MIRHRGRKALFALVLLLVALGGAAGCGSRKNASKQVSLQGAGASFPFPLYSRWIREYGRTESGVRINYQSIGSGAGIRQIIEETVDFGASDAPMTEEEMGKAPREILHIPTALGAVVVVYNLPEVKSDLALSPDVLADIFLGKIVRWNDTRLKELNPDADLPGREISVIHRSDGSGTTFVFSDYLSDVSSEWADKVGKGKALEWPVGIGAKGNEGVTGQVVQRPGTIGYVELAYAEQNDLAVARLRNKEGHFVTPAIEGVSAAAAGVELPADLRVSIVNAGGRDAYPLASFTYILAYKEQKDTAKGKALARFLWWAVHDGQEFNDDLGYAPLPPEVVSRVEEKLRSLSHQGRRFLRDGT